MAKDAAKVQKVEKADGLAKQMGLLYQQLAKAQSANNQECVAFVRSQIAKHSVRWKATGLSLLTLAARSILLVSQVIFAGFIAVLSRL